MTDHHGTELEHKQKRGIRLTLVSIIAVICLFMAGFLNTIFTPRVLSTTELRVNGAVVFENPRIVEELSLMDHRGEPFDLERLKGQWSLLYFGFAHCPDICPTTLAKLNQVISKLDGDFAEQVQVVMVSVDPARDTPEVLAEYVPFFNPEFIGVTGEFLDTMRFARNVNVAFNKVVLDNGDYTIDHTGNLVLINPKGHYHGFFKPPFELARLKLTLQSIISSF